MSKTIADLSLRLDALDCQRSFIVQAPAGSGKTELLTQRVLELLSLVKEPEEILAITFTVKAASEMQKRVLDALAQAHVQLPEKAVAYEHEKQSRAQRALANSDAKGWALLSNPSRLQIRTIDGFCAEVVRRLPVSTGLGGSMPIALSPERLYQQASQKILEALELDVQ